MRWVIVLSLAVGFGSALAEEQNLIQRGKQGKGVAQWQANGIKGWQQGPDYLQITGKQMLKLSPKNPPGEDIFSLTVDLTQLTVGKNFHDLSHIIFHEKTRIGVFAFDYDGNTFAAGNELFGGDLKFKNGQKFGPSVKWIALGMKYRHIFQRLCGEKGVDEVRWTVVGPLDEPRQPPKHMYVGAATVKVAEKDTRANIDLFSITAWRGTLRIHDMTLWTPGHPKR